MDMIKDKISMARYIYFVVAAILLLCGITYLLSSCSEKEIIDPPTHNGPKNDVYFTLSIGIFSSDQTTEPVTRSAAGFSEQVSNVIRVADDVYMYATLKEDHPVTTRATGDTIALKDGAFVRVIAYSDAGGNTYMIEEGQADYKVVNGVLEPLSAGLSIHDDTYEFVAYTFNDAVALPSHATPVSFDAGAIDSAHYLLWGKTAPIVISALSDTIRLTVGHLFSRVKIKASTATIIQPSVDINKIVGAKLSPSYRTLFLDPGNGVLTPLNLGNPESSITEFKRWSSNGGSTWQDTTANLAAQDVESDYCMIYSHRNAEMALKIANLRVDDTDLGTYEFRFSKFPIPMEPGHSYVLNLNFKRLIWSGSNIFWDGTKLTFKPEGTPLSQQGLQGVYFPWGSLIGISPTGAPNGGFSELLTILYIPDAISYTWSTTNASAKGWTRFDIRRILGGGTLVSNDWLDNHESRNYLYSEAHNPIDTIGDICHYISQYEAYHSNATFGNWRMPNSREFGIMQSEYQTANLSSMNNLTLATLKADGTTNFYENDIITNNLYASYIIKIAGGASSPAPGTATVFPAGGHRDIGGDLQNATYYLSGSPTSTSNPATVLNASFYMRFVYGGWGGQTIEFNTPTPIGIASGFEGLVRCIKLDGGGIPIHWTTPTVDVEDWDDGGIFGDSSTGTAGQGDVLY